ncbi:MAG: TVP38/TMEM64 family protein [Desulfobaccales bacterium]
MMQDKESAPSKPSVIRPLVFLALLGAIIFTVRYLQLDQYLEKERLRQAVAGYGALGPLIYMLIWMAAPPLFLPRLPIGLAGGILFGPFWGVVYTIFGATMGATLAFLVARYLARDWVAAKLTGTKLATLDEKVGQQGWKIVALTRLVPLFPYNLLNYAFGLTRISLLAYVSSTFIFMLPMTIAIIYFSANILDLLRGQITWGVAMGIILVALVGLIPVFYKKLRARREMLSLED